MISNSEDEGGLCRDAEFGDISGPCTSSAVAPSPVLTKSPSEEKSIPAKPQKPSAKKTKLPNEKKKSAKPAVKYSCPHCSHETTNIVKHFAHKRQHRELTSCSFKCPLCNYESKIKGGLQRHVKRVHTKERPFTCSVCDFRAVDKPSMAKHIISKHKKDIGVDLSMYIDSIRSNNLYDDEELGQSSKPSRPGNSPPLESNSKEGIETSENRLNPPPNAVSDEVKEEKGKANSGETENLSLFNNTSVGEEATKDDEKTPITGEKKAHGVEKGEMGKKSRKKKSSAHRNLYSTPEYREMRARKLTCEFCLKQCNSQRSLLAHFNEHKSENVFCPICHMFIVDSDCRRAHIENHFDTSNRYTCATCLSTFTQSSEVIAHQQRDHRKSINVVMECMFCSFNSRSQERFSRHMTRCHMFGSDGPKHNAFDISKMKTLLLDYERNKVETGIKVESSDEPEKELKPSCVEEEKKREVSTAEKNFSDAPLDVQTSAGELEEELESSFFDISAHMNDSLENLREILTGNERLGDVETSNENRHKDNERREEIPVDEKNGDDSCEQDYFSDNMAAGDQEESFEDKVSIDSIRLTSTLGKKLVKSSVESSGRGLHGKMGIPINEFSVPFELLKESGALREPSQQHLENSIHLSRISAIANTCDKKYSISARNTKMKQRKTLSRNPAKLSGVSRGDSVSGM